jgi:hypothetical protein
MKIISKNGISQDVDRRQRAEGYWVSLRRACMHKCATAQAERRLALLLSSGWRPSDLADAVDLDADLVESICARSPITRQRRDAKKLHRAVDMSLSAA